MYLAKSYSSSTNESLKDFALDCILPNMTSLVMQLTSDTSLRGTVKEDGTHIFAVFDFISLACHKKDNGAYARKTYSNLVKEGSEFKEEMLNLVQYYQFTGAGQRETPTMTIRGLQRLLMILGGKVAEAFRVETLIILQRYLDGDHSMCQEISENRNMGQVASFQSFSKKVLKRAREVTEKEGLQMPSVTYVYATKSPAFSGLIKIGKTISMVTRLCQLNTSCAPAPHVVVAVAPTFDNNRDEKAAHAFFSEFRREGEFFEISEEAVKQYFSMHIIQQYNLEMMQKISTLQGTLLLQDDADSSIPRIEG